MSRLDLDADHAVREAEAEPERLVRAALACEGIRDPMPEFFGALVSDPDDPELKRKIDDWTGAVEAMHERLAAESDEYRRAAEHAKTARPEAERAARVRQLIRLGVPEKDASPAASGNLDDTDAMEAVRGLLAGEVAILVLAGRSGLGKTTAASWALAKAEGGRFITASRLARTSYYDDSSMSEIERLPVLVIDDIGTEFSDAKGMFAAMFDAVVNERYAHRRPTVITTNLTAKSFGERYGERIIDRIRECGSYVELKGDSMRKRGRAA